MNQEIDVNSLETGYSSLHLFKNEEKDKTVQSAVALEASILIDSNNNVAVFICKDTITARNLYKNISFFSSILPLYINNKNNARRLYPVKNIKKVFLCEEIIPSSILYELQNNDEGTILILTKVSFFTKLPDISSLSNTILNLKKGQNFKRDKLIDTLISFGYEMIDQIEAPSQFAVRGEIIDIFGNSDDNPLRLDFFDDEIQDIRFFDINTQRSVKKIDSFIIFPINNDIYEKKSDLFNIVNEPILFIEDGIFEDDEADASSYRKAIQSSYKVFYFNINMLPYFIKSDNFYMSVSFKNTGFIKNFHKNNNGELNHERAGAFFRSILSAGFLILLIVRNEVYSDRLRKIFSSFGIFEGEFGNDGAFYIVTSGISCGIMAKNHKMLVFTEEELFKEHISLGDGKNYRGERVDFFESVRELNTGDYVVHAEHGIAKFMGIKNVASRGLTADYLELIYAGGDKVFVPSEKIYLVHKYISSGETKPELSKLGSKSWEKAKKKAKQKVEEVADDLVRLYAKRKSEGGFAFSKEDEAYREFEEDFEYEETEDQARAINDVLSDMAKPMPMDRLVCGDVGYGKTEVAIRAAYKAALDGKQVIFIAPTTLLVEQHYKNFKKRFENYPVNIAYLSRLISYAREKLTVKLLEKGDIDIIIGTHKLLSDKIKFHDPGLLIIDEEQKFGAFQKEKIKKIRYSIDVLALSATPIPRTLYLSMSGIRDLSIINTPPAGRKNVITNSSVYNDNIAKEYIYRELRRGGQVYFIDDRISHLDAIYENFRKIMPDIKIGIVHGRLNSGQLEDVMHKFYQKAYDLLLSTTIIESGIDNPNVNTIIINNAENFGLSQLYQLRGRVGRSHFQAYCLLFVNSADITKEQSKRIKAIKEYNELGSGFKLAMADLEIRGAGNILGGAQSGNIESVGLEMCMQMLKDEIDKIQGKVLPPEVFPEIKANTNIYIPDNYIADNILKLMIYRKLSGCVHIEEVDNIREELEDRFGRLPKETENLISASELKVYMKNAKVSLIEIIDNSFNIEFHKSAISLSNSIIRFVNNKEAALKYVINFLSEYKLKIRLKGVQENNLDVFKVAINILQQIQSYVSI